MEADSGSQTPSGPSQPSASNTPQGTAPTPQTQSELLQAASTASAPPLAPAQPSQPSGSKRRRGLGNVTPNACNECRKKRAKCDGEKPCGRCKLQKEVDCVYQIPVRQSKDTLRNEIETLRAKQRVNDAVLSALSRPLTGDSVYRQLRQGQPPDKIADWLDALGPAGNGPLPALSQLVGGEMEPLTSLAPLQVPTAAAAPYATIGASSPSLAPLSLAVQGIGPVSAQQSAIRSEIGQSSPWQLSSRTKAASTQSSSQADMMNWSPGIQPSQVKPWNEDTPSATLSDEPTPNCRGPEDVLSPCQPTGPNAPAEIWTDVTRDSTLVQHLLALYFCWEYPTFASLSKAHFLRDFQAGCPRFCSPMLVNALLALGCRFSKKPMARANPNDPYSSGDHFFKESLRLLHQETSHHSLTTIQALGIMSIREASCGRDSESWYYAGQSIRLAIEMGLHRPPSAGDEDELAVQAATFWGAFSLDHFPRLPPKPLIIDEVEASLWVPYTDDGAPLQRSCEQPSNVRSVYKCFCELSELVHQSLYVLHSPIHPLTAKELLSIYTQYLNWYGQVPEVLRLGHNFTPAVLFVHMYYQFAILLLFRPLIKLRIIGSPVSPRDVCLQAAEAIQALLRSYARLYTLRRTPSFVPYFVLTSVIMHLAIGTSATDLNESKSECDDGQGIIVEDGRAIKALQQGVADLSEMAPCHHFAEQALHILRYLAKKWKVRLDIANGPEPDKLPPAAYDKLVRPYTSSLNFFAPNLSTEDFLCAWGKEDKSIAAGDEAENPLFWPFPMQGRPILQSGNELEQAGFAML
ncbi:hypothetical protein CDD82_6144 [Ophiocordyceps australis]|uniref:Zn(2)-C6 fungal-type domain-containing protein n=1 Tax=Ophiocordyceps australis TaxID=1399860 RepID=A0A2C5YXA4_9HYPO|nr:hypothetical protein CDD82_6144 [Ophiocordyceps australis]